MPTPPKLRTPFNRHSPIPSEKELETKRAIAGLQDKRGVVARKVAKVETIAKVLQNSGEVREWTQVWENMQRTEPECKWTPMSTRSRPPVMM